MRQNILKEKLPQLAKTTEITNKGKCSWNLFVSYIFLFSKKNFKKYGLKNVSYFLIILSPEHPSSQSMKKLEKKSVPDETVDKFNKIEKMLLVTALNALKARRENATPIQSQATVGSETLNHINLLMKLFQTKQSIHNSNIDDIMKPVSQQQNEITETHQIEEQPVTVSRFYHSNRSFKTCFKLILR